MGGSRVQLGVFRAHLGEQRTTVGCWHLENLGTIDAEVITHVGHAMFVDYPVVEYPLGDIPAQRLAKLTNCSEMTLANAIKCYVSIWKSCTLCAVACQFVDFVTVSAWAFMLSTRDFKFDSSQPQSTNRLEDTLQSHRQRKQRGGSVLILRPCL